MRAAGVGRAAWEATRSKRRVRAAAAPAGPRAPVRLALTWCGSRRRLT